MTLNRTGQLRHGPAVGATASVRRCTHSSTGCRARLV